VAGFCLCESRLHSAGHASDEKSGISLSLAVSCGAMKNHKKLYDLVHFV